ncbi:MAG: DUF1629 domain-containing protein [Corticimicrobacter sp.]|uniref:imm11 family protein n=1 Tax=Corticimicrobacter sp. TaxID=2678536 RepID=UPI0032DA53CA
MEFYFIDSLLAAGGDVIDIRDPKGRISSYFIWGEGDGAFLGFTTLEGIAQENIEYSNLLEADYLSANIGVPVFSERAMREIEEFAPGSLEWARIRIACEEHVTDFYLCRTNDFLDIVDKEASSFRMLRDGDFILEKAVYKGNPGDGFLIVRDSEFKTQMLVSRRFMDFCRERKLKIDFRKA